jgi:hypothetical protein
MTTDINRILELEDLESMDDHNIPSLQAQQVKRFINNRYDTHSQSGMNSSNYTTQDNQIPIYNDFNANYTTQDNQIPIYNNSNNSLPQPLKEQVNIYEMAKNSPTCLEFAEHHANCPICSKFYNNDKTLYIAIIIILSIICILLLKKVLNL